MTEKYTRRRLVGCGLGLASATLAGCGQPKERSLTFSGHPEVRSTNSGVEIRVEISYYGRNVDSAEAAFHDVAVIGYMQNQDIICRKDIRVLEQFTSELITLECPRRPEYLTFVFSDTDCRIDTSVDVLLLHGPEAQVPSEVVIQKDCNDSPHPVKTESETG